MAGTHPSFDAARFISGVRGAMEMGMANSEANQPEFHFRSVKSYPPGTRLDQDGNPLDPNVSVTVVAPPPVKVPVAVEMGTARYDELPVGAIRPTKVVLTLLDDDYQLVKDAIKVKLGGDTYVISYRLPTIAMFDVDVHQFVCFALDEK